MNRSVKAPKLKPQVQNILVKSPRIWTKQESEPAQVQGPQGLVSSKYEVPSAKTASDPRVDEKALQVFGRMAAGDPNQQVEAVDKGVMAGRSVHAGKKALRVFGRMAAGDPNQRVNAVAKVNEGARAEWRGRGRRHGLSRSRSCRCRCRCRWCRQRRGRRRLSVSGSSSGVGQIGSRVMAKKGKKLREHRCRGASMTPAAEG
ncbi:hypothetical protein OF83DRAFT_1292725, partial [Amylostereum chailletii]